MKASWRSPSNIALVKYWGKHGLQLPRNPSISFTLSNAFSETSVELIEKISAEPMAFDLFFDGKIKESFRPKIEQFLIKLLPELAYLNNYKLLINSTNSFPHSTGIASSASSMSALALCLLDLAYQLEERSINSSSFLNKASELSRLGSGSACRSVFPHLALWGRSEQIESSSDHFAIPFSERVDSVYKSFHNDILIVSSAQKSVSSSVGHGLMDNNAFSASRYQEAHLHLNEIITALDSGNLSVFGNLVEAEALQLHALMMCSTPSFILIEANSIALIKKIRHWRKDKNMPLYFSLDAGPNLHLMYPDEIQKEAQDFIQNDLIMYCENNKILKDKVGGGPKKIF